MTSISWKIEFIRLQSAFDWFQSHETFDYNFLLVLSGLTIKKSSILEININFTARDTGFLLSNSQYEKLDFRYSRTYWKLKTPVNWLQSIKFTLKIYQKTYQVLSELQKRFQRSWNLFPKKASWNKIHFEPLRLTSIFPIFLCFHGF